MLLIFMHYIFIIIFYTSMCSNAFAYLDPGTGGIIIQALLAFLAAVFAYTTFFWNKMKSFLSKIFKKKDKNSKNNSSE